MRGNKADRDTVMLRPETKPLLADAEETRDAAPAADVDDADEVRTTPSSEEMDFADEQNAPILRLG